MVAAKYKPSVSRTEFDDLAKALKRDLKKKYDRSKNDPARAKLRAPTAGAFGGGPDLDSKTVAKWSSTVKKHLGCDLDPDLIRRGGYASFDDFWRDFSSKARARCSEVQEHMEGAFA